MEACITPNLAAIDDTALNFLSLSAVSCSFVWYKRPDNISRVNPSFAQSQFACIRASLFRAAEDTDDEIWKELAFNRAKIQSKAAYIPQPCENTATVRGANQTVPQSVLHLLFVSQMEWLLDSRPGEHFRAGLLMNAEHPSTESCKTVHEFQKAGEEWLPTLKSFCDAFAEHTQGRNDKLHPAQSSDVIRNLIKYSRANRNSAIVATAKANFSEAALCLRAVNMVRGLPV